MTRASSVGGAASARAGLLNVLLPKERRARDNAAREMKDVRGDAEGCARAFVKFFWEDELKGPK
jgi:hypothetical protein